MTPDAGAQPIDTASALAEQLDPDAILRQEFEYARATAIQANEDRTQVVNLYLILVGGVGSALFALPALATRGVEVSREVFAAAFFLIGMLGWFSVLKLIRLRQAWHDSVLAMNRIKDFYVAYFPEIAPAFRWRTETIPVPGRLGTISFDLTMLVALLDSVAVGGGVHFLGLSVAHVAAAVLLCLLGQVGLYFRLLGFSGRSKPAGA